MTDFDEVLERLVNDPAFQVALRADPDQALSGYRLDPDERALLDAQLDSGVGADRTVESRISKSGIAGMIGPVASALGFVGDVGPSAPGLAAYGPATDDPSHHVDVVMTAGEVHSEAAYGPAGSDAAASYGPADPDAAAAYGPADPHAAGMPATDYHIWVDADGDGKPDAYRAVERGDGGVDILVDRDGDGRVDFIGHDYNRDGLIDDADYDTDGDGVFDTRMTDVDGDGWLDVSSPLPDGGYREYGPAGDPS
jgi:hypothetical protein